MRPRSLFWPLVLVAAGIVWILVNLGTVSTSNLWALVNFFPFLLLILGIGLIVRARWLGAGFIVSALAVVGMLLAVVFAPSLGWDKAPAWGWQLIGPNTWSINLGGTIPGSGVIHSETRDLPQFNAVSVAFPADVVIRQGPAQSVTLQADDNLLPQLRTRVMGGVLYIDEGEPNWSRRVNPSRAVQIDLTVTGLNELDFSTAGSVLADGLESDSLELSVSGAGKITLTGLNVHDLRIDSSGATTVDAAGTATDVRLGISGLGSFQGASLSAQTADVDISGAGSATLWVQQRLTAEISGTGSVGYYGSPSVHKDVSGLGSVHKLGDK